MWHPRRVAPRVAIAAVLAASTVSFVGAPPTTAVVPQTIVTIEWHDGNADQVGVLPILQGHGMHATFLANTVPPADPHAVRTVPSIKKSTKLVTMERYVLAAETAAQTDGSAWTIFVFHHLCGAHDHCGPYVVSDTKFGAFLEFLHAEAAR